MTRLRIHIITLSSVVLIFLFLSGAIYLYINWRFEVRERVPATDVKTVSIVEQVKFDLEVFHDHYHRYPVGDNIGIISALRGRNSSKQNPDGCNFDMTGTKDPFFGRDSVGRAVDGWGMPLIMKNMNFSTPPIVYSVGENGIDNDGSYDDIKGRPVTQR